MFPGSSSLSALLVISWSPFPVLFVVSIAGFRFGLVWVKVFHLCVTCACFWQRVDLGGKGGKRKGGGLAASSFGAGGLSTPSPTPSASGSVAGVAEVELAGGMSYDVPVKVPRVGVAESVADVAALSEEVGRLAVDPVVGVVDRVMVSIRNLRVVSEVRSSLLSRIGVLRVLLEAEGEKATEMMRLRRVLKAKEEELMDAAVALGGLHEERDGVRGELEFERVGAEVELRGVYAELALVRGELGSVRGEVAVVGTERDEARKEAAYWSKRVDRFVEGRKICDTEMERLLQEGFDLLVEVERLKSGKVLKGKDKGTRMPAVPPHPVLVGVGVQAVVPEVSTVGVQTDVSRVQVVRETTYASVAAQTCTGVVAVAGGVDVEMSEMGGGPPGPPPDPVVPVVPVVPVPGVVRAQALLIHGVDCHRGMGALLPAARRLRVGECTVRGVRWLLGVGGIGVSASLRLWCTWTALW